MKKPSRKILERIRRSYSSLRSITSPPLRFIRVIPLTVITIQQRYMIVNTFLQKFLLKFNINVNYAQNFPK